MIENASIAVEAEADAMGAKYALLSVPGVCPSINTLLSGRLRDRISRKNEWQMWAWAAWFEAGRPTFDGPVSVTVRLYFPDRRKRDWPNFMAGGVKIMIDQLVESHCLIGDDDEVLDMGRPEMLIDPERPRTEIEIRLRTVAQTEEDR